MWAQIWEVLSSPLPASLHSGVFLFIKHTSAMVFKIILHKLCSEINTLIGAFDYEKNLEMAFVDYFAWMSSSSARTRSEGAEC